MTNYSSPAAQGSAQGTGAYSESIAAQTGVANNDGHATDSAGNVAVDFAFGPFPVQPNDERAATISNTGGSTGDYAWSATTKVASGRLDPALDNHSAVEAGWAAYPSYFPAAGSYMVTAVSGNGTTVSYTSQNRLKAGDSVNITGLTAGAYNLSAATVATANALGFTVTNAANAGALTGEWRGEVALVSAASGGDGSGLGYIVVPSVIGLTIASALDALKDAGYEAGNITTASAVTPAVSNVALTSNVLTVTTDIAHGYAAGQSVVIAGLTNGAGDKSADAGLNGTYTIVATPLATTFTVAKTATNVNTHVPTAGGTAKVAAKNGLIKLQSTAAASATVATSATITITPYYAS